jgi:phosphoribosylformylglycinamidine synthase
MGEACKKFDTPVTGGNVSFYNQNPDGAVYPTPTIGMVGLLDSEKDKMTLGFKNEGDLVYLLGSSTNDIHSSEYLHKILGVQYSPAPHFDLEEEYQLQKTLLGLIKSKLIQSAHDVSEGGLFIALVESGFVNNLGFEVQQNNKQVRKDAYLFGESQSRVVISVSPTNQQTIESALHAAKQPFEQLGIVKGKEVVIDSENWGMLSGWRKTYDEKISSLMK